MKGALAIDALNQQISYQAQKWISLGDMVCYKRIANATNTVKFLEKRRTLLDTDDTFFGNT